MFLYILLLRIFYRLPIFKIFTICIFFCMQSFNIIYLAHYSYLGSLVDLTEAPWCYGELRSSAAHVAQTSLISFVLITRNCWTRKPQLSLSMVCKPYAEAIHTQIRVFLVLFALGAQNIFHGT